jgi:hypothetical protein
MAVTPTTFKTRFPEFSTETDPRIQIFIDDSEIFISESKFGTLFDLAVSYLTAHYLSVADKSSSGSSSSVGSVASKSVEGVSVSFNKMAAATQADDFYASTIYGQRYLELRSQIAVGNVLSV